MALETGYTRPHIGDRIKRIIAHPVTRIAAVAGILGIGAYESYEKIPAIHQTLDAKLGIVSPADVPSVFDTTKTEGLIGDKNTLNTTLQEVKDAPTFDENGNLLLYLPPPSPGKVTSYKIETNILTLSSGDHFNPDTAVTVNFYTLSTKVGKGNIEPMPSNGNAVAYYDDKGNFLNVWAYIKDPEGVVQRITIGSEDNRLRLLQDLPKVTPNNQNAQGMFLERGTPLFIADATVDTYYNSSVSMIDDKATALNIKPLSLQDSSGQEKAPRVIE